VGPTGKGKISTGKKSEEISLRIRGTKAEGLGEKLTPGRNQYKAKAGGPYSKKIAREKIRGRNLALQVMEQKRVKHALE